MMKKLNYILIIICIIGVIFSFSLFSKEGYAININSKNRDLVSKSLSGEIENTDNVTKIILGQGWHSGELTIYHSYGKKETINNIRPVVITVGEYYDTSTEKACACTKINLKIGFLKSSFFAININSIGLAAKAKRIGSHQVR